MKTIVAFLLDQWQCRCHGFALTLPVFRPKLIIKARLKHQLQSVRNYVPAEKLLFRIKLDEHLSKTDTDL